MRCTYILIISALLLGLCGTAQAEWDWKNDADLMLWTYADTGFEEIDGSIKWRDNSGSGNHMTVVGMPQIKENAIGGHRAMELSSSENEYFYVDFDETYVGSSTIFIVGSINDFREYKGMFSTSTPTRPKTHNTFETYLLNNNIESASMNASGTDINKDRQFNNEDFVFNKYHNFISRYENIENAGMWEATSLKTYYGVYDEASGGTSLSLVGDFGNRAYSSEARFNTYVGFTLGSRWNFTDETPDAEFAEVIIFKRALSEDEILEVSEYISDKYFKSEEVPEDESFDFDDRLDLWIRADNYPEDTNFDSRLNLEDFSLQKKYLESEDKAKTPGFTENYINGYGAYIFDGTDDFASCDLQEAYSGEMTFFVAADINTVGSDGNIFSTGEGGITLSRNNGMLEIKSGDGIETVISQFPQGVNIYAVKAEKEGDRINITSYINGAQTMRCQKVSGWTEHTEYSFGDAGFDLSEAIVYKRALSDYAVTKISKYLSDKYMETFAVEEIENDYLDEEGNPCEVVCENGAFKTTLTLVNNRGESIENARFVCAMYDNGRLVSILLSPAFSVDGGGRISVSSDGFIDLPDDLSEVEIKYMFWNGGTGMTPVRGFFGRSFTFYE